MRPRPNKYARFFEENPIPATRGPENSKKHRKIQKTSHLNIIVYRFMKNSTKHDFHKDKTEGIQNRNNIYIIK